MLTTADFFTLFLAGAAGIALGAPIAYTSIRALRQQHYRNLRGRTDSTDADGAGTQPNAIGLRSGLNLYIDHGTGVHYVGTSDGGLTPRVCADGALVTDDRLPARAPQSDEPAKTTA